MRWLLIALALFLVLINSAYAWEYTLNNYKSTRMLLFNYECNFTNTNTYIETTGTVTHRLFSPYYTLRRIKQINVTGCENVISNINLYSINNYEIINGSKIHEVYLSRDEAGLVGLVSSNVKCSINENQMNQSIIFSGNGYANVYYYSTSAPGFAYEPDPKPNMTRLLYDPCFSFDTATNQQYTYQIATSSGIIMLFNSSYGDVHITVTAPYQVYSRNSLYLWNEIDGWTTLKVQDGSFYYSEDKVLRPNELYALYFARAGTVTLTYYFYVSDITMNVSIRVSECNYKCTDWYPYNSTHYYRECYDIYGNEIACPTYYEYKPIVPVVSVEKVIGFEEDYAVENVGYCGKSGWPFCGWYFRNKTRYWPKGWSVSNLMWNSSYLFDYVTMTTEWSSERSKSLKLWYIPPSVYPSIDDVTYSVTCDNQTTGSWGYVYKGINETIFVEYNVTFPAPNSVLRVDYKKCSKPPDKWDDRGFIVNCGYGCYAREEKCEDTPVKARTEVKLIDINTGNIIFDEYHTYDGFKSFKYLLTDLETNHNYSLRFSEIPESSIDSNAYCTYIDNVKISVLTDIPECKDQCDGLNLYTVFRTEPCILEYQGLSVSCAETVEEKETAEQLITNCEDGCYGADWYDVEYDNETGTCNVIKIIRNNPLCIAIQQQKQEEKEREEREKSLTEPLVNVTQFESAGLEFITPFFTPIVLFFLLIGGIGSYVAMKTGSWQIGVAVMIGLVIVFSTSGLLPSWFAITFIIIAGLILGKTIVQMIKGG